MDSGEMTEDEIHEHMYEVVHRLISRMDKDFHDGDWIKSVVRAGVEHMRVFNEARFTHANKDSIGEMCAGFVLKTMGETFLYGYFHDLSRRAMRDAVMDHILRTRGGAQA